VQPVADLRFTAPLKIVYSLTLGGVAAWYLFFYLSYCLGNVGWTGDNVFSVFLMNLSFLFVMTALPLVIFTLVFRIKGGGLDYFRSWNAGKKLSISALTIIIGYIFVVFRPNTSVTRGYAPNHYDFYHSYFGLILIAAGFVSILLYRRQVSSYEDSTAHKIKWKSKKTVLVFSVILIFSILIGGYYLKVQMEYENLQQSYLSIKEGFPFLVNDEWTNNEGVDSNYINYKGAIFNSGLNKKYNITLLVSIRDPNGIWLERAEIPIGDIDGWNYIAFDVKVDYSGEMTDVFTTYAWDDPNPIHG